MSDRPPHERNRPVEPEIIPPGEPVRLRRPGERWIFISQGVRGAEVRLQKPGLGSIIVGALVFALAIGVVLAILTSVVLIVIPVIGLALAALLLAGLIRGWKRAR